MTQVVVQHPRFTCFEDYLSYADSGDRLYELFNGELIEVPPESGLNVGIANFLFVVFLPIVGYLRVRGHGLELEVRGEPRNRYPDLTIIQAEHIEQLQSRNTLRLNMTPPELVVEVVSPGEVQHDRDYVAKRYQYHDRRIPSYWIVDPQLQVIVILTWVNQGYQEQHYRGDDYLPFQETMLAVTAAEVLSAGRV